MTNLQGKVAFVTGAAGGIGAAIAEKLSEQGAQLFLTDIDETGLVKVASRFEGARFAAGDLTDEAAARGLFEKARDLLGRIDIAVLNAGIVGKVAEIGEFSLADFDRVLSINLRSVFIGLSCLMPEMKAQGGGSIVILSSIAGVRGAIGLSPYTTSKHAVIGLMRSAALEGAMAGVRVNTVNPSAIDTGMMKVIEAGKNPQDPQAAHAANVAAMPMKRYGRPEEVAAMVAFLASDEASFCSGNTYFVDGALTAGR